MESNVKSKEIQCKIYLGKLLFIYMYCYISAYKRIYK